MNTGHSHDQTLPGKVELHARTRPGAPAIERGDVRLTYAELDSLADHLAHRLTGQGVRHGSVVGLHLGRSIEWVVGMLAILKAGAACMSLDPAAPPDRAVRAVEAASPDALLAAPGAPDPPGSDSAPVLRVDLAPPPAPAPGPPVRALPDDLAFVIHTSGSSGRPKIVMAQHSWLAGGAAAGAAVNGTTAEDRGSWLGPAGAGIAVNEVAGLLWRGASIHVAEQEVIVDPPALRDWLVERRITQAFVITPVGELLQSLDWPADAPLRVMTVGGAKLNRWAPPGLPFEVAVSYGSLEAFQIANTLHPWEARCTPATATARDRSAPPPVGRPLPGVSVHVLEDDLTPTPPGDIGELWIDSPTLSLGYLGDPALTADRFRPNPYGAPGSRLYRSGDAGRFRPDGILEHHGRIDEIVKIRGHRVELGEVEWVLGGHPRIVQVCVATAEDTADGPGGAAQTRLVACFVPDGQVTPAELWEYARHRLPEFMVPAAYVPMERLPRNTSDKVDRLALPPADWRLWRPARPFRAPEGEVEAALARLFAELLAVERVGADDNFLGLGGDSLLAARLQGRIGEEFGVRVPLKDVLGAETLAELAERITERRADGPPPEDLAPIVPRERS